MLVDNQAIRNEYSYLNNTTYLACGVILHVKIHMIEIKYINFESGVHND